MRAIVAGLLCGVLLLVARTANSQVKLDVDPRAAVLAPLIDEQTLAVAHLELDVLPVDRILDEIVALGIAPGDEIAGIRQQVVSLQKRLLDAGAKDIYAVVTLAGGLRDSQPFFAIPLTALSDEKAIREALPIPFVERRGDVLLLAPNRDTLVRLATLKPDPRPELAAAIEAAGENAAQFLFLPPKHYRRVLEETVGDLPKELGGGSVKVFTGGILWAALGIETAPKPGLRIVFQSEDAGAATALQRKFAELLQLAGSNKTIRADFPDVDAVAALLVPRTEDNRLVVSFDAGSRKAGELVAALVQPIQAMRRRTAMYSSMNKMRQVVLAMQIYEDHSAETGTPAGKRSAHLPLPAIKRGDGKPLLSWRVAILPYLQQKPLYDQFHLDEPWDSPHNRPLVDKMPEIYRSPLSKNKDPGLTNYLLPVGNGEGFSPDQPTTIKDITDGTANTIAIVEGDDDRAVIWTKPEDWQFDPNNPAQGLGHLNDGVFVAAFFDCHAQGISASIDPKVLKALFTRAGGEPIDPGSY